jgi:diaminopimelate decarboxylase
MTLHRLPGAPHIRLYGRATTLCCEQVPLAELARRTARRCSSIRRRSWRRWPPTSAASQGRNVRICYAMKANSSLAILQVLAQAGCGFDIVSGGELERVMAAGADPRARHLFRCRQDTRGNAPALELGIACFNVESEAELDVLNAVALDMGKRAPPASPAAAPRWRRRPTTRRSRSCRAHPEEVQQPQQHHGVDGRCSACQRAAPAP